MNAHDRARTLVLLHAFPLDRTIFDEVVDPLAETGWEIVVPDLRGYGGSAYGPEGPEQEPSLGVFARDVLAGLDRLGARSAVVAGVSLGGYVAMELVRAAPDRVAGLGLIDTKASADPPAAREHRLQVAAQVEASRDTRALADAMLPSLVGPTTLAERPAVAARIRSLVETADPRAVAWTQRAMAARPDSLAALRAFPGPIRAVWGDEDALSPRSEQDLLVTAGAELTVVPAAGHLVVLEQPAPVAAALVDLLDRVVRLTG